MNETGYVLIRAKAAFVERHPWLPFESIRGVPCPMPEGTTFADERTVPLSLDDLLWLVYQFGRLGLDWPFLPKFRAENEDDYGHTH